MLVEVSNRAFWLGRVNSAIDNLDNKRAEIDRKYVQNYNDKPRAWNRVRTGWITWKNVPMSFQEFLELDGLASGYAHWDYPTRRYGESLDTLYSMRKALLSENTGTIHFNEEEFDTVEKYS